MNKKIFIILMVTVVLVLSACGGSSSKASSKAISCANSAIKIADNYLDGELDYSDTIEELDDLNDDMEYVDELTEDDENKAADFSIQCDISILQNSIIMDNYDNNSKSYSKVEKARNSLADDVKSYK